MALITESIICDGLETLAKSIAKALPNKEWFEVRIQVRRVEEVVECCASLHSMETEK